MSEIQATECVEKPWLPVGSEKVRFGNLFCLSPNVWQNVEESAFRDLCVETQNEGDLLISDEGVYGGVVSPQPWMPETGWKHGEYIELKRQVSVQSDLCSLTSHLERLQTHSSRFGYGKIKVLITTRRQDTKLASGYAQVSNRVRGASQKSFEKWVRYLTNDPLGYSAAGGAKLDYFEWWRSISGIVGKENMFLLPFELLKQDSREFLWKWLEYIDVPKKEQILESVLREEEEADRNSRATSRCTWSLSDPIRRGTLPAGRVLTALGLPFRIPLRWPDFSREEEIRLSDELSDEILSAYVESNQSLDESLPHLDLERYGYY